MIEKISPREQSGRDSYNRYRMQIRSAAVAALEILNGGAVDWIYCDYHDDFVVRINSADGIRYHFFQVKTKGKANHHWSINEIFGLNTRIKDQSKQKVEKIRDSFVGKLLLHTVLFDESCHKITLQTNVHFDDKVNDVLEDINTGGMKDDYTKTLISKFNECFIEDLWCKLPSKSIKKNIAKINFIPDVQYLKSTDNNFEITVGEQIYNYSEIDLQRAERKEIILKLLDLVDGKSSGVIHEINLKTIQEEAGISINDLLGILSISKDAYNILSEGGDKKAVKSASIIQRLLRDAGAGKEQIEYASRCKTKWDEWRRSNRHIIPDFDINAIIQQIQALISSSIDKDNLLSLADLRPKILGLIKKLKTKKILYDLGMDLVVGGIFAELVRVR
jgi:hypothetical protein